MKLELLHAPIDEAFNWKQAVGGLALGASLFASHAKGQETPPHEPSQQRTTKQYSSDDVLSLIVEFNKLDKTGKEAAADQLLNIIIEVIDSYIKDKDYPNAILQINRGIMISKVVKTERVDEFEARRKQIDEQRTIDRIVANARDVRSSLNVIDLLLKQYDRIQEAHKLFDTIEVDQITPGLKDQAKAIFVVLQLDKGENITSQTLEIAGDYYVNSNRAINIHKAITYYNSANESSTDERSKLRLSGKIAQAEERRNALCRVVKSIGISARVPWTTVGRVRKGQILIFSGRGEWRSGPRLPASGIEGRESAKGEHTSYLQGKVGEEVFKAIGVVICPADGVLQLGMYDGSHSNNTGTIVVTLRSD